MDALILIVIGLLGIAGEFFLPSGLSGIIGLGFLSAGLLMMFGFSFEHAALGGLIISIIAGIVVFYYSRHLSMTNPIKSGAESFIGLEADVTKDFTNGKGLVRSRGEDWSAASRSGKDYKKGEKASIVGFSGVFLEVE